MIEARGRTGQVSFDGQQVTITRKGFLARARVGPGEKQLHVGQIAALRWKPAGLLVHGFIGFTDENRVAFTRKQMPLFERLRAAVDEAISRQHAPQGSTGYGSAGDELAKLASLRDGGLITAADFETVKSKLLGTR